MLMYLFFSCPCRPTRVCDRRSMAAQGPVAHDVASEVIRQIGAFADSPQLNVVWYSDRGADYRCRAHVYRKNQSIEVKVWDGDWTDPFPVYTADGLAAYILGPINDVAPSDMYCYIYQGTTDVPPFASDMTYIREYLPGSRFFLWVIADEYPEEIWGSDRPCELYQDMTRKLSKLAWDVLKLR